MKIQIDDETIKKEFAFFDAEDLLYTLKSDVDFLESHNKNYTKKQYYAICKLQHFINNCKLIF